MQPRSKTVSRWITIVFLIIFLGGYLTWARIPDLLSSSISKRLNVLVQIGSIGLFPSKIAISKLHIGNPSGYKLPEALSINEILCKALFTHYFKDQIIIDELVLNTVYVGLEFDSIKGASGNWTVLFSNLESIKESNKKKSTKSLLIKKVYVRNINADVLYHDRGKGVIHLPSIEEMEFDNISSEGGFPIDQLMSSVLGKMLKEVFTRENIKDMIQSLLPNPQDLNQYIRPFKGLFGQNEKSQPDLDIPNELYTPVVALL